MNGDYSVLGSYFNDKFGNYKNTIGGSNVNGASDDIPDVGDIVRSTEFEDAVQQALQSDYIKTYDKIGDENLQELAKKTGSP